VTHSFKASQCEGGQYAGSTCLVPVSVRCQHPRDLLRSSEYGVKHYSEKRHWFFM